MNWDFVWRVSLKSEKWGKEPAQTFKQLTGFKNLTMLCHSWKKKKSNVQAVQT